MTESEFLRQSAAAVERMREMNARSHISDNSRHKMPPVPSFVKVNDNRQDSQKQTQNPSSNYQQNTNNQKTAQAPSDGGGLNIPFLDNILKDGDSSLILGLLLVLMSENTDKMLLFALIYILL